MVGMAKLFHSDQIVSKSPNAIEVRHDGRNISISLTAESWVLGQISVATKGLQGLGCRHLTLDVINAIR
jgi:hypothetical protein